MDSIYLDHNSTTPLAPEAAAAMAPWQSERFGNPASQHAIGRRARQALEDAREEIGRILGANLSGREADRVIFTSGGSEANNLAVFGMTRALDPHTAPGRIVISVIEHHSVAVPANLLERRGWQVHRLGVTPAGVIDVAALDRALTSDTRLASVMLANNETGVIQPVGEIAARCRRLHILIHTDAAQIVGKLAVDFRALAVDAMTIAAHKFRGPLGIGALVVRHGVELAPFVVGGFQQEGQRGGTESVALAVGMHAALAAWERESHDRALRMQALRDRLESRLAAGFSGRLVVNGADAPRLPHTSNVAFRGLDRQALVMALDLAGIACSTGSACASGSSEPSPALSAMGCQNDVLAGSVRFSLGAATTTDEIDEAAARILSVCAKLATGKPPARTSAP
jgi:cysteine desulfurase